MIIIDNLPIVPVEKFERLQSVMRAIYGQIGVIKEGGLWIPILYTTYGYCFIEYATPQVGILVPDLSFPFIFPVEIMMLCMLYIFTLHY